MARPSDRRPRRQSDAPGADFRNHRSTDDAPLPRENGTLEIHTPFGFAGKVTASQFIPMIMLLALLAFIGFTGYFIWDSQVKGLDALNKTLQLQTGIMTQYSADLAVDRERDRKEHADIARVFGDMAYIIAMPPERRALLGLEEPAGLRKRIKGE